MNSAALSRTRNARARTSPMARSATGRDHREPPIRTTTPMATPSSARWTISNAANAGLTSRDWFKNYYGPPTPRMVIWPATSPSRKRPRPRSRNTSATSRSGPPVSAPEVHGSPSAAAENQREVMYDRVAVSPASTRCGTRPRLRGNPTATTSDLLAAALGVGQELPPLQAPGVRRPGRHRSVSGRCPVRRARSAASSCITVTAKPGGRSGGRRSRLRWTRSSAKPAARRPHA